MAELTASPSNFGSEALDNMVKRLNGTADPRRRYEYVLWLAKKLQIGRASCRERV